jgi:4-amino-4-deoxy-L-arabinose transferase-like glycosyltransferase
MLVKIVALLRSSGLRARGSLGQLRRGTRALLAGVALLLLFTAVAAAWRPEPAVVAAVYLALGLPVVALSLRRIQFDLPTIAILLSGLGLYLAYLGYTEIGERNYDGPVQLEYIKYLVKHRALPPPAHCLVCHHPPLYYALGALVYAFFKATRLAEPVLGLQLFSLAIFFLFIVFGVLTAARLARGRREVHLVAALLVFWPYSVHNSVRVHNDTLVSTLMAAALYFAVAWAEDARPRDLYLAGLFSALSILTKSSGYIVVAVVVGLLAARISSSRDRLRYLGRAGVVAAMLAAALAIGSLSRGGAPVGDGLCGRVLGSACKIARSALMENEPYNYLYFDVQGFLKEPYVLTDKDETGRQLFWNHLLKSSLFGSHNKVADPETAYAFNRAIAGVMSALLLGMIGFLALGAVSAKKAGARRYAVVLAALASSIAFMMAFRIMVPAPHHSDVRHIFPVVIPMSVLYAAAVRHFREKDLAVEHAGTGMAALFLLLSIVYFLPKYDLLLRYTTRIVTERLPARARVVPEGTPWDSPGNLRFEATDIIEIPFTERTVSEIEVSLDSNDRYEIQLVGVGAPRAIVVGPGVGKGPGLARYVERLEPPAEGVQVLRLRAVEGDRAYSLGHLLIR